MRLFTLALPLAAALVLAMSATAARPPTTTTKFSGTWVYHSTPSADPTYRDVTVSVPFTHKGAVKVRFTLTFNGVVSPDGALTSRTFRGTGSDTFTWLIPGTDCLAPEPGDTISYHLELISGPKGAVLDEITTDTFTIT